MISHGQFAITAILAVCVYYYVAWFLFGRDPKLGIVVPLYEPPGNLSPAMLRYIWKKNFDERVFWAGILSLVAKGVATLHSEDGAARLQGRRASSQSALSNEERILQEELVSGHVRKGVAISMLDPATVLAVTDMGSSLRRDAVGRWFTENQGFVLAGSVLSAIALCVVAGPESKDQWGVLALGLAVISPGVFYLFFLSLRAWDLAHAARAHLDRAVLQRGVMVFGMLLPCIAAITMGAVVLGTTFGLPFLAAALFLAMLNILLLQWMKAPTAEGTRILTEIEGFRIFLKSVEALADAAARAAGGTRGSLREVFALCDSVGSGTDLGRPLCRARIDDPRKCRAAQRRIFLSRHVEWQASGDYL